MTTARIQLPPKLLKVFGPPRGDLRYRGAFGGRGSGKSFSFALMAAVMGYAEPLRVLCTRDLQISIKESMFAELRNAIQSHEFLSRHYEIGESFIRGANGTEFIFRGLRHNMSAIKSMAQIDLCIVEEAEAVPDTSWRDLIPTIRAPKSEIWPIWNPERPDSPVQKRFRDAAPKRAKIVELNWRDNPWFPKVLEEERASDQERLDPAMYAHIWEGEFLAVSEAQIFARNVRVAEFEPTKHWDGPYYGLDFGFSADPTAGNKMWIHDSRLYIEHESHALRLDLDDTAQRLIHDLPEIEKHVVRADCARPESISYLQRHGIPRIEGAPKWTGSVEDGVEFLKAFTEIVIHPRCPETIREARLYSYKLDRLTGEPLPQIVDAYNHHWDDIRYALAPLIRRPKKTAGVL